MYFSIGDTLKVIGNSLMIRVLDNLHEVLDSNHMVINVLKKNNPSIEDNFARTE